MMVLTTFDVTIKTQLTLKSCISYLLLEKPLLNKQNYVGSYKAKLNSFMQYSES